MHGPRTQAAPGWSPWTGFDSDVGTDGTLGRSAATGGFPQELQVLADSVERTGPRSTERLVQAAAELEAAGIARDVAIRQVFGRFPVGGLARYSHDWWYPRFGPGWRLHQGTDVFADHGTPVRAPAAGVVGISDGGLGGLALRITEPDGTYWYLAHLSAVADGLSAGDVVALGDVVGRVGNSGNARTTPPHLHIELHPGGAAAVDVKPVLDAFLDEAEAALPPPAPPPTDRAQEPVPPPAPEAVAMSRTGPAWRRLPGLVPASGPPGSGGEGRDWALAVGHPWMEAGWVGPPWGGAAGTGPADDPVAVAAGLLALGAVLGAPRARLGRGRVASAAEPVDGPAELSGPPATP